MISTRSVRASARFSSRIAFAGLAALGVLGASSAARAQSVTTCTQDSDCAHGLTCQAVGATACPADVCASGSACTQPVCDPVVIKECEPGPCTTDSDCATGMVCFADSAVSCPVAVAQPKCAADKDCGAP